MAKCNFCHRDMSDTQTVKGCVKIMITFEEKGGEKYEPVKWDGPGLCHDCNASPGFYHHPGCDMERCPKCGGQLITCGCWPDEDPPLDDNLDDDWTISNGLSDEIQWVCPHCGGDNVDYLGKTAVPICSSCDMEVHWHKIVKKN